MKVGADILVKWNLPGREAGHVQNLMVTVFEYICGS